MAIAITGTLGLTLLAVVASPGEPASAALPDGCAEAAPGGVVTCTYDYTGATQSFTVPDGVTSVDLTATGAAGGKDVRLDSTPGLGGMVVLDDYAVAAGDILYIEVGGVGGNGGLGDEGGAGGYNGGGAGGAAGTGGGSGYAAGGGGGGASDVRFGGNTLDARILVGPGGGAACNAGTGGGPNEDGSNPFIGDPGAGGSLTAGGAAGGTGADAGQDGVLGIGGDGAVANDNSDEGGCGGGGGYFGGGGGSESGSGGGGSSYVLGAGSGAVATSAAPASVTVSYEPVTLLTGVSATNVVGGEPSTGSLIMSAGPTEATVTLTADPAGVIGLPSSVVVPAGSSAAPFDITTTSVTVATPVTITATFESTSVTTVLTLSPPQAPDDPPADGPELANSGVDTAPGVLAAAALLLSGLALLFGRRLRVRRR